MVSVNCEYAKDMSRIRLFENKFSLIKEVAIFSIIDFKNRFYWYVEILLFFRHFWIKTSCMGYMNCESAEDLVRMYLFEKKLTLYKEVAIFYIFSFKIGFIGIVI